MESFIQNFMESFTILKGIEYFATALGIIYIYLLTKEKPIAWVFAFVSACIFAYLVYIQQVYFQTILQGYYAVVAVYGYIVWTIKGEDDSYKLKITDMNAKEHLSFILVCGIIAYTLSETIGQYLDSNYKLLDASILTFAILTTIIQARKKLSNWIYWIVINTASAFLYYQLEIYGFVVLVVVSIVLSILGYLEWKKTMQNYEY